MEVFGNTFGKAVGRNTVSTTDAEISNLDVSTT
jgi:hypothetical protein